MSIFKSRLSSSISRPSSFPFTNNEESNSKKTSNQPLNIDPLLALALEPRFMFDAAGLATAVSADDATLNDTDMLSTDIAVAEESNTQDVERMDALANALMIAPPATETNSEQQNNILDDGNDLLMRTAVREVVFIDASVTDIESFLNSIPTGAELVTINSNSDGLSQIAEWLSNYDDISAIHIISHGDDANVQLGNSLINNDNLADYTEQLGSIGDALSSDGDILFYGCNLGESDQGLKFIDQIAFLTDADIAASDDLTGSADLGGDWDLEISTGTIEANQTYSAEAMKGFSSLLTIPGPITFDAYTGGVSDNTGNNATYVFGAYTVVLDGATSKTYSDDFGVAPGYAATALNETQLTVSITGYTFDTTGLDVSNTSGSSRSFTITSNVGGDTYMYTIAAGTTETLTLTGFNDITNLIITPDAATGFYVDNLVTSNITAAAGNTPPTINLGGTTAVTVTQNVATDVDLSTLTFADVDGDPLTVNLVASEGTLVSTDGNTTVSGVAITGSGSGTLVLTGSATDINTYLDTTTKINYTTPLNDTTANTIAVNAFDGAAFDASIDSITVNIAVNTAPTITLGGTTAVTVAEDVQSNINLSALTFADGEGDNLTVTLTADAGTIASAQGNTTTGGVTITNSGTAAISLAGTAANIHTYLDTTTNINYTTPLNDTTANSIAVKVNDGSVDDATNDNITVNITAVNDDPTVTGLPTDVTVIEDTLSNLDLSGTTFADVDSGASNIIVALTVAAGTFATPADGSGVGSGVTETLVNATTITLEGSVADINTYLATASNIKYTGVSNAQGDNVTTLTLQASDQGNTGTGGGTFVSLGTVNIDITNVNDIPTTTNLDGDSLTYNEGDTAKLLDVGSDAIVADGDNDFDGGNLMVTVATGIIAEDLFSLNTSGTVALAATTAGSNVSVGGTVIGTLGNNIAGGNDLVVNLNANATSTNVQALVRAITYQNTNTDNPSGGSATVRVTINDGDGGTSTNADITLNVIGIDDAPTITGDITGTGAEDGGAIIGNLNATDPDGLTDGTYFSVSGVASNGVTSINPSSGAWSYTPNANFNGSDSFTVTITDDAGSTTTQLVSITVTATDDGAATITGDITGSGAEDGGAITGDLNATDPDGLTDSTYFSVTAAASDGTASINPNSGAWSYTPNADFNGSDSFTVTVTDDEGFTTTQVVNITVTPVNDAPTISKLDGDKTTFFAGFLGTKLLDTGSNANINDIDSANFDGGVLTVSITSGGDVTEDQLGIITTSGVTLSSGLDDGSTITIDGVVIGTIAAVGSDQVDVGEDLVVNLNANATPEKVKTLIRALTYRNTDSIDDITTLGDRNVRVTVSDGDGETSLNSDVTVNVADTTEPPVVSGLKIAINPFDPTRKSLSIVFKVSDPDTALADLTLELSGFTLNGKEIKTADLNAFNGNILLAISSGQTGTRTITVSDGTNTTTASFYLNFQDVTSNSQAIAAALDSDLIKKLATKDGKFDFKNITTGTLLGIREGNVGFGSERESAECENCVGSHGGINLGALIGAVMKTVFSDTKLTDYGSALDDVKTGKTVNEDGTITNTVNLGETTIFQKEKSSLGLIELGGSFALAGAAFWSRIGKRKSTAV